MKKEMMMTIRFRSVFALLMVPGMLFAGGSGLTASPVETLLASGGKTVHPVVVSATAGARVRAAAETLADYLGRISGGRFEVVSGDGLSGIALGLVADFPALQTGVAFDQNDPLRREDYLLRTHGQGVYLIGATELAVENALWDLLYRLGYRHYFPGDNWEIIPYNEQLRIAVDTVERPDYAYRKTWYGSGTWRDNAQRTERWRVHNRMQTGFVLNNTHTYGAIITAFPEEFAQHPEYLCQVDGKPTSKLNIANPGLRRLVVRWALEKLEKTPQVEMIPLDPSDGGGWGHSAEEDALGPISSRVVLLANDVAQAINEKYAAEYGRKYVGIYAYNEHAMPPTIPVNSNVVVLVATAFNKSGLTLEQLIEGWQKQGAMIGIRDYYNVMTGSQDLPGKAPGSNIRQIAINIPRYHKLGARFLSAEGGDGWGVCGLGYYLASRFSWDIREAARLDALVEDFLTRSFGDAKAPMKRFYDLLTPPTFLSESELGKMYQALDESRKLTRDPGVLARIGDLLIYTRYVDLRTRYNFLSRQKADTVAQQKLEAFESMVRFLYRARSSHMVHLQGLWRDMPKRDKLLSAVLPPESRFSVDHKNDKNSLKSADPITEAELQEWLKEGLSRHRIVEYTPVSYSPDLVPATGLELGDPPRLAPGDFIRNNILYTWVREAGEPIHFTGRINFLKGALRTGRVLLQKVNSAADGESSWQEGLNGYVDEFAGESENAVEQTEMIAESIAEIQPVQDMQKLTLIPKQTGLYRIIVENGVKYGVELDWDGNLPMVHETTDTHSLQIRHRVARYFYVPKGTGHVAGFIQRGGVVLDAKGIKVFQADASNGAYFNIPVEDGMDGKLWTIHGAYITPRLLTVPPFLARSASELMLPREVVAADSAKP